MSGILSDLQEPILEMVGRLFEDPELYATVTYSLYQGQDVNGDDDTSDFSLLTVPSQKRFSAVGMVEGAQGQAGVQNFITRETDLPDSVVVTDLTVNDRITWSGKKYRITEIDKTLGFVIEIRTVGE